MPIGALLISKQVVDTFSKGTGAFVHFQTYHGHPVACAAALAVQEVIRDEGLIENCQKMGKYLSKALRNRLEGHKNVGDIRGRGLVWGVSLVLYKKDVLAKADNFQIELVKDKATKEPFPVADKIAPTIHANGLRPEFGISLIPGGGVADGTNGDLIVVSPAYNISIADADLIVDRAARAIESVLGPVKESKL